MPLLYQNKVIPTDKEGYLKNLKDWSREIATLIAAEEGIALTVNHWEMIDLIREFFTCYEISPAMRPLVKFTSKQLGKDKGNSIYLLKLFPSSPAKSLSKIAGLPRPTNCL
ncbi:MAG: tRNA 2-thiouridine synthesizing protein E [Cellvibrionaceae bacterium]|jgi:tRNA 2-thiouridine synthesizing protein E